MIHTPLLFGHPVIFRWLAAKGFVPEWIPQPHNRTMAYKYYTLLRYNQVVVDFEPIQDGNILPILTQLWGDCVHCPIELKGYAYPGAEEIVIESGDTRLMFYTEEAARSHSRFPH